MNYYYVENYGDVFVVVDSFGDIISYHEFYDEAEEMADCMNGMGYWFM